MIEKFNVDVNFAIDKDGSVIHNSVRFGQSEDQDVLRNVHRRKELDLNIKESGISGLDFALSNLSY